MQAFEHNTGDTVPWYRQPLVWMIIAIPGSAIIAGFITLAIAINTDQGVLIDDYYQQGKAINKVLTRDRNAKQLGISGKITYGPVDHTVHIDVSSRTSYVIPPKIDLKILHRTRSGLDEIHTLDAWEPGIYRVNLPKSLKQGGWIIQVSTDDWRIHGTLHIPGHHSSILEPL